MRAAIDADFNAQSRQLSLKLEIFFAGLGEAPVVITKDDYLMDADWLEEGAAESANPFGAISSNELSFRLYNTDGMFNPTNSTGPYYGQIKSGVCIIPYIKPINATTDIAWTQLGKYYVASWTAAITNIYADVVANDEWQTIFNTATPDYKVTRNITFKQLFDNLFTLMQHTVLVDSALIQELNYAFIEGTPTQFLQSLAKGSLSFFSCDKLGVPTITPFIKSRAVRATLTDGDQIISIASKQSIIKSYEGVEFTYSIPQGITQEKLVELRNIVIPSGNTLLTNIAFSNGPIWQINSVSLQSQLATASLLGYTATPWRISLSFNNVSTEETTVDFSVYGTLVSFTDVLLADDVVKVLKSESRYVQNALYAAEYKATLSAFVNSLVPILKVTTRGNPLLSIGDRVIIQSDKYNVTFDGILQSLKYDYTGGLACEMTLLNSTIIQGVT